MSDSSQSHSGAALKHGAQLGGLMVLLVLIIGAIDQTAGMPRSMTRQAAQSVTGAACDKNSFSTGGSIGVETEATKEQKKTCTPISCFANAEGGQTCMIKPAAQALSGGAGGLMSAIGEMLKALGGGGGGGGDSGSGETPPYVDPRYQKVPKCTDFTAASGTKPLKSGESTTLSWLVSEGTPEASGGQGAPGGVTVSPGVGEVSGSTATVSPTKTTTYTLKVENRTGFSTCKTKVFVNVNGGYSDVSDGDDTEETDDSESTSDEGSDDESLENPLGSGRSGTTETNTDIQRGAKTATGTGALNYEGFIGKYGEKEDLVSDPDAFRNDPNALKADPNAFGVEDLEVDEAFDQLADELGKDGVYSKEDMETLERAAREAEARANMKRGYRIENMNDLTPDEVRNLWNRPRESVTGGLTEDIIGGSERVQKDRQGFFTRFGSWLKNTFCFWCTVDRTSFVGQRQMAAGVCVPGLPGQPKECPKPKPAETKPAAEKPADTLTGRCDQENKKIMEQVCKTSSGGAVAKPKLDPACVKKFEDRTHDKSVMPVEWGTYTAKLNGEDKTKADKTNGECQSKEKALKERKKCHDTCKNMGYSTVPVINQEDIGAIQKKGYTICAVESAEGRQSVMVCRKEDSEKSNDKDKDKTPPAGQTPGGPAGQTPGGPAGQTPGGSPSGGNPLDTKAAQGLGEGLGKGLAEMMKPKQDQGNQNQQNQKPWWWDDLYGKNTPTEAPKCTEDSVSITPKTIKKGESATITWDVTGKGTLKTIINFTTTDEKGAPEKGSLGVVDGGSVDVSPERTTTYTIKVANEIGTNVCTPPVKVFVKPADEEDEEEVDDTTEVGEADVSCDPETIKQGEEATVVWSCPAKSEKSVGTSTEDGEFTTSGDTEGSADVKPIRDATYVIRCRDKFNKEIARNSCRVEVSGVSTGTTTTSGARPTVSISAEPPAAPKGTSVKVSWRSQNTASCVVYGPGCDTFGKDSPKCFKEVGRSGYVTGNLYETSQFRVECIAPDRKTRASDAVTIEVSSDGSEEIPDEEYVGE